MRFNEIVEKLQKENKGYVVLVKCGIFFNAIGKDAIVLSELFGLNAICFKEKTCKCGIPVKRIERFMQKMAQKQISFVIYLYDKNNIEEPIKKIYVYSGKIIEEKRECFECEKCKNKKGNNESLDIETIIKNIKLKEEKNDEK